MMRYLAMGMALMAALVFAAVSPAQAACTLDTQVAFHGLGSFFHNCPDAQPMTGYAYLLSDPVGTNSAGQDVVCEDATLQNQGFQCQPEAAAPGDGIVTITYDWGAGNPGSTGCPNPPGAGDGTTPILIEVVANDGSSIVLGLTFQINLSGFLVEQAHPYNPVIDNADPLACSFVNGPTVTGSASANSACVNVPVPTIYSDCDPGTIGDLLGLCGLGGTTRPTTARGKLYTTQAPCGASPDPRVGQWTLLAQQPNASGDACNTFPAAPTTRTCTTVTAGNTVSLGGVCLANTDCGTAKTCTTVTAGNTVPFGGTCVTNTECGTIGGICGAVCSGVCNFVGVTGLIGGAETPAMLGSVQIAGPGAATDKVKIDSAAFAQGRLKVGFSTENEATIVGFNVYAGTARLNASLIAAKGAGSNAYSFEIGRGAVKANRSVTVQAVKSDGTVETTAPHAVK